MKRSIKPFGDDEIILRLVEKRDLEAILDWRNRDDARVWFKTSGKLSLESHQSWFDNYLQRDDDFFFLIEAGDQSVGQCAIYGIDHKTGAAEIGRFLAAPNWTGKGYIRRSCSALVRFGFEALDLSYLFLEVMERNVRAIDIYKRCGFREESRTNGLMRMSLSRNDTK